jgi:anti-anti-sigma factor
MFIPMNDARNTPRGEACGFLEVHSRTVDLDALRCRVPFDALDLATVDEFARWVREQLACVPADEPRGVVLDLAEVEFVMAAGIRALLDIEAELCERQRTLGVINVAPIVTRVFEICGVDRRWVVG